MKRAQESSDEDSDDVDVNETLSSKVKSKKSSKSSNSSKSNLEVLREENISRNAAFLQSLGLSEDKAAIARQLISAVDKKSENSDYRAKTSRKKIKTDDNDYNEDENSQRASTRKSSRLLGAPADNVEINDTDKAVAKIKPEKSNYDFDFENNFEEDQDDPDYAMREKVTPASLRTYIESLNSDHLEIISDEQMTLCVYRIQTMSSKRLATRIKMIARAAGKNSHEKLLVFYYGLKASNLILLSDICKDALTNIGVLLKPESSD